MNVWQLIEKLKSLPSESLVCIDSGPVNEIINEPGANEPFVLIRFVPEKVE